MNRILYGAGVGVLALAALAALYAVGVFGAIGQSHVNAFVAKKTLAPNISVQVHSANNAIQSQGYFEGLKADFDGFLTQIKVQEDLVKSTPSPYNQTNLAGLRQECVTTAQEYNAAARSVSSEEFRSADLPPTLNSSRCL